MNQEAQLRANSNYSEIVDKMEKIQAICADLVTDSSLNWGHVGSLAHINEKMDEILEGFEND